ncbi:protein RALF-like 33 [Canna indica]|uniref:Protein RALF-like 33 n=1 Tax=Canna indica TaxID=4628 RepID=A0AAQ3KPE9_9LILI|nr:protein RALF-like 33 [Canna indica]
MMRSSSCSLIPFFFFFLLCASELPIGSTAGPTNAAAPVVATTAFRQSTCNETGGCRMEEEDEAIVVEFQLDSEINRRLLAGGAPSVTNGALSPNKPVCPSSNGHSYNCGGQSGNSGGRPCYYHQQRC